MPEEQAHVHADQAKIYNGTEHPRAQQPKVNSQRFSWPASLLAVTRKL
jgi:hypothetical protein